jgi:hypothetical protein
MKRERIELTDNFLSACLKLAEGNPGAITAIADMCEQSPAIDPESAFGELAPLLSLDTHGIYGSQIWTLYKYVCSGNAIKTLACLRAVQLGLLPESMLMVAIANRGASLNTDEVLAGVRKRLPSFAPVCSPQPVVAAMEEMEDEK